MHLFLGIYTLFLVIVWGFFVITKIHAYKFKHLSNYVELVTRTLLVVLIIFSVIGYGIIIYIFKFDNNLNLQFNQDNFYFNEINY